MSRVLVVGINYAPEHIGTGKYTAEMCEWLAARGHTVRVVTGQPYYPSWSVWPEYRSWQIRHRRLNGVDVLHCPIWVPAKPRGVTRVLHLATFAVSSMIGLMASARFRPDLVINVAPTLASAPAAWLYSRASRSKCWLHVQDFEMDAAIDMGMIRIGRLVRMTRAIERWLFRRFDRVSTISEGMAARLQAKGVASPKRILFPNWVNTQAIHPLVAPSPYRAEMGIPEDAVVALYSGNMAMKQGLELLSETAKALRGRGDLYFVFGGAGPGRERLEIECRDLPNVRVAELQPMERLNDWLGLADIHLLPQLDCVEDLVMPSKLTGMLASGRPVLGTCATGSSLARTLEHVGVATEPGVVQDFVSSLLDLVGDKARRDKLGAAARALAVKDISNAAVLADFESEMKQLIAGSRAP
ncbi:WcaI family glycosyltransferase [Lysobacter sp. TAF61]|uniref:WcaI family glycosyltransferase n=1 Tax=Lysobacter sp. TAF61 TaxID=3233072 RepID=UPI003F9B4D4E